MNDLADDLRRYIDGAAVPVTVEEVRDRLPAGQPTGLSGPGFSGPGLSVGDGRGVELPRRSTIVKVIMATAAVTLVLAGAGSLVAFGPRSRPVNVPGRLRSSPAADQPAADQPPATVTGTEETIQPAGMPLFFSPTQSSSQYCLQDGSASAFSVGGSPTFVLWPASKVFPNSCATDETSAVTYEGNGLDDGSGIDSDLDPATGTIGAATTSVFLIQQWPVASDWVYVWSALPSDVAYVTYSYQGSTLDWESPTGGTAALVVPPLSTDTTLYSVWHTAPFPVLSAYDAAGNLLGTMNAPRMVGDDFGTSG